MAAPTPFAPMPTPLGGEREPPAGVFEDPALGCDPSALVQAEASPVEIVFGGPAGERYRPRCVLVPAGTRVIFRGEFSSHPLAGGVVRDGQAYRDPSSQIPFTGVGTEAAFISVESGVYPFFCQVHWVIGMRGAVIVR
jgi:plastocyanin